MEQKKKPRSFFRYPGQLDLLYKASDAHLCVQPSAAARQVSFFNLYHHLDYIEIY